MKLLVKVSKNGILPRHDFWHDLKNEAIYWILDNLDSNSWQVVLAKHTNVS